MRLGCSRIIEVMCQSSAMPISVAVHSSGLLHEPLSELGEERPPQDDSSLPTPSHVPGVAVHVVPNELPAPFDVVK